MYVDNKLFKSIWLFILWWSANSYYAIDSEMFFKRFESPWYVIDLTISQAVLGLTLILIKEVVVDRKYIWNCFRIQFGKENSFTDYRTTLMLITVGSIHTLGTALTAFSYSSIGATSTLVWKLTESFSAVVMKSLILNEPVMLHSTLAVCTVLCGVVTFSCRSFQLANYLPVISSNLVFPLRNSLLKLANIQSGSTERQYYDILLFGLPLAITGFLIRICSFPVNLRSLPHLLRNAVLFNLYQFSSISLLRLFDTVTHSLLNTFKRFTAIIVSIIVNKKEIYLEHLMGMNVALGGFLMYIFAKQNDKTALFGTKSQFRSIAAFSFSIFLIAIPISFSRTPSIPLSQFLSNNSTFMKPSHLKFRSHSINYCHVMVHLNLERKCSVGVWGPLDNHSVIRKWLIGSYASAFIPTHGLSIECNGSIGCTDTISQAAENNRIVLHFPVPYGYERLRESLSIASSIAQLPSFDSIVLGGFKIYKQFTASELQWLMKSLDDKQNLDLGIRHWFDSCALSMKEKPLQILNESCLEDVTFGLSENGIKIKFVDFMVWMSTNSEIGALLEEKLELIPSKIGNSLNLSILGYSNFSLAKHDILDFLHSTSTDIHFHSFNATETTLIANMYNISMDNITENYIEVPSLQSTDLVISQNLDAVFYGLSVGIPSIYVTDGTQNMVFSTSGLPNISPLNLTSIKGFNFMATFGKRFGEDYDRRRCLAAKAISTSYDSINLTTATTIAGRC